MVKEEQLWIEKHRPHTLKDIVGHTEVILRLQKFAEEQNSMHFLFSGPPATGKTTAAICFARDLYGDTWKRNFIELNASDERGIDVVRNKIKDYARTAPVSATFKIIFMDEVDNLCLPKGTEILMGSGKTGKKIRKIEDIPQDKFTAMQSVNLETGKIEKDKGKCIDTGYADFYKIKFSNGKEVIASGQHPFFHYVNGKLSEITTDELDEGSSILDYEKDLNLRKCNACGKVIPNGRFCSITCKDIGHSKEMLGEKNPAFGKVSWAKGLTKYDDDRINKGLPGDLNPSKRPEVRAKTSESMLRSWQSLTDKEKEERLAKSVGVSAKNRIGKTYEEIFGEDRAEEERAKRSALGVENYKNSNYRRQVLLGKDSIPCGVCDENIKVGGINGIYIHHIDGDNKNNEFSNLMPVCPKCHNMVIHDCAEKWMKKGWEITHVPRKNVCIDGINCPEKISVISKEYIGRDRSYNITMKKNPSFFLANGILTHNTSDAQSALRRTMERYSSTCRFILSCNYDNKLIQPIRSRLAKFYFGGLSNEDMRNLILNIASKENLVVSPEVADTIVELSDRDARDAINTLQICSMINSTVTIEDVRKTFQVPDKRIVEQLINLAIEGDINQSFEVMTNHIINTGFDTGRVLRMISNIVPTLKLDSYVLAKINDNISTADHYINSGDSVDIQMKGLLANISLISKMDPICLKVN